MGAEGEKERQVKVTELWKGSGGDGGGRDSGRWRYNYKMNGERLGGLIRSTDRTAVYARGMRCHVCCVTHRKTPSVRSTAYGEVQQCKN